LFCRRFGTQISGEALPRGELRLTWRADFRRASSAGRTALSAAALARGFPAKRCRGRTPTNSARGFPAGFFRWTNRALCRRFGVWISGEALPRGGLRLAWRADFQRASFAGRTALSAAALVRGFPVEPFDRRAVAGRF